MATAWDRRGAGGRTYSPQQYSAVVAQLRLHMGRVNRTNAEAIHLKTGVPPRTVRAVFSDADGVEFVIAESDDGVWVAEEFEDAVRGTRRLQSQAHRMLDRVRRREEFAQGLPRRQGALI